MGQQPSREPPRHPQVFISGAMQGSSQQTAGVEDLGPQNYRSHIRGIIEVVLPGATIVDPLVVFTSEMLPTAGLSEKEVFADDAAVTRVFGEVVKMAADSDVVISNLPVASMGSAVELWEARKHGRVVITISPMRDNWLIRSTSDHNFETMEAFERGLAGVLRREGILPRRRC